MTSSRLPQGGGGRARRARSLRRDARERYRAAARAASAFADASADKSAACIEASSDKPATSTHASVETPLTGRVRALYEDSVTPVREIARLIGVSERTLYKYVEKGGWRRRHACPARDAAVAAANAGRAATPGLDFAPAKGAGGRFIRREDVGKPFQRGLKALDPQGAAAAAEACVRAGVIAEEAAAAAVADAQARTLREQAERAERDARMQREQAERAARAAREQAAREAQAWMRMFERLMELFVDLAKFRAELGDGPGGGTAKRAHRLAASLQHAVLTLIDRMRAPRGQAPACD
jgi:hypothetical protein